MGVVNSVGLEVPRDRVCSDRWAMRQMALTSDTDRLRVPVRKNLDGFKEGYSRELPTVGYLRV